MTKHGHGKTREQSPEYKTWGGMLRRVRGTGAVEDAKYYSGITVDPRWETFENFLEDMGPKPKGTSLDRIKGDRGYEPGNCRWATPKEQARNTKANVLITFEGRTQCLAACAEEKGGFIRDRLKRGWTVAAALSTPKGHKKPGSF